MKYRKIFILAAVAMTLAACTDDLADAPPVVTPVEQTPQTPIVFGSLSKGMTRADFLGADAAAMLGKQFVVTGYKGNKTNPAGTTVFDNYVVKYEENTANTTESNTSNWEYVGVDRIKHAIDNGITRQSTKYWDYTKAQYDFIAWSTGMKTAVYEGTPASGEVLVSAITPATAFGTDGVAYTMTGTSADLTGCYVADLVTVEKAQYGANPVTISFRSLGTKVRIGIYETIPGYSVRNVEFYSAAASDDATETTPRLFTTSDLIYTKGMYTVFYPTVDTSLPDNNQAHIRFTPEGTQSTLVNFTGLNYTIAEDGEKTPGKVYLGRTSNTATMAGEAEGNYYTQYLPNEVGTNLNLRVNYTLESIDGSGETIYVQGATAQVPSIYAQWKAGYAYTYIFKISDRTNGHTGDYDPLHPDDTTINSDPAGLYPITFDAVVVNAEDNDKTQETITTVTHPSITTYQEGSNVLNNNEYAAGNAIYVVVTDGETETTPDLDNGKLQTLTDKANLYTIPTGKTEADVVDALQMRHETDIPDDILGRNGLILHGSTAFTLTNYIDYGVDGNTINVGTDQAMQFTPSANTTYAFVYTKKAASTTEEKYQPKTFATGYSVQGYYRNKLVNAPSGDVQKGVIYFTGTTTAFEKATVFLGQDVSNLYIRTGAGTDTDPYVYTPASGYAVSGTEYYYTTDNGMTYTKAQSVGYAAISTTTLYTRDSNGNYTEVTDKTNVPLNNTAYYFKRGNDYVYCVFNPQRTQNTIALLIATDEKVACTDNEVAIEGMTYFDKYTYNDGVYYTKIIKVQ